MSMLRVAALLSAMAAIWAYFKWDHSLWVVAIIGLLVLFYWLVRKHLAWVHQLDRTRMQVQVLEDELFFLQVDSTRFNAGQEFQDNHHAFTQDLDVFTPGGIYPYLNRCGTWMGKSQLAKFLSRNDWTIEEIKARQEAVQELTSALHWRQELYADARLANDSEEKDRIFRAWLNHSAPLPKGILMLTYFTGPALLLLFFGAWLTGNADFYSPIVWLVVLHLLLLGTQAKKISSELQATVHIYPVVRGFKGVFQSLSTPKFSSSLLQSWQQDLVKEPHHAARQLDILDKHYDQLEQIQNLVVAVILNGLFGYHLHVYQRIQQWKMINREQAIRWLETMGKFEAMNSLANLAYNESEFVFPEVTANDALEFENLGHPNIPAAKRVCNSIAFDQQQLMLLTGSNMSGKSTFLRTLGINMVLAQMGAPICASHARIRPMPVWVSMRQSDSLQDSESYFFAEVKRLRQIMDAVEQGSCFVLLDEILRGTNSDDKRSGTIGVLRKLLTHNAIGFLATHDLEVCQLTNEFPAQLKNMRFEVQIKNDALVFDYRLLEGICTSKSASFLMKKMGIIR